MVAATVLLSPLSPLSVWMFVCVKERKGKIERERERVVSPLSPPSHAVAASHDVAVVPPANPVVFVAADVAALYVCV